MSRLDSKWLVGGLIIAAVPIVGCSVSGGNQSSVPPTQGLYDPKDAERFAGAWLNLKTGRNYVVVEVTSTMVTSKGCINTLTNCSVSYPNVIRDGKLYSSYTIDKSDYPDWPYPKGWWAQVTIELSILGNGHLQSVITERYSFGPVEQRVAEYVRVSRP